MNQFLSVFGLTGRTAFFVIVLALGLAAPARLPRVYRLIERAFIRIPIYLAALIVCSMWFFLSASYLFLPNYFDQVEPAVAVQSALLLQGRQIYPAWDAGQGLYATIYGPVLYFVHAAVLMVSKSIPATKFAGIAAAWGALLVIALDARKTIRDSKIVLLVLGCVVLILFRIFPFTFSNRPDPFLILLSALAGLALRLPKYEAALAIGFVAGLAVGMKPHGALYITPAAVALLVREASSWASGLRLGSVIFAVAAAVVIAPFLDSSVSLKQYLAYMAITAEHGLSLDIFVVNLTFFALMIAPGTMLLVFRRPLFVREIQLPWAALIVCGVIAATIGAKYGAGVQHVLPFLPPVARLTLQIARLEPKRPVQPISSRAVALGFFALYLCTFGPIFVGYSLLMKSIFDGSSSEWLKIAELDKLYSMYPLAQMGVSDTPNYRSTFYRVIGVVRGTPVYLEFTFLMDIRAVGLGEDAAQKFVEDCKVPEWILPVDGIPFSLRGSYEYQGRYDLISDRFRQAFDHNYRVVFPGKYYNVWGCR